jgi:tryptophan halogenase
VEQKLINRIVIAGGGTAGWMVAACLSKMLGKVLDIKLIESDEIGTVGVGEATIPTLVTFHRLLDINEQEFMAATQGTFKLGIGFENWRAVGQNYIHSFGLTGTDHWSAGFQHFWLKGRERKLAGDYGDYCLELKAAQADRFAHLPRGGMNCLSHRCQPVCEFLRKFSEASPSASRGKIVEVRPIDVRLHQRDQAGFGRADIEGDLFIDFTGFRGLLIGQALHVGYEDGRIGSTTTAQSRFDESVRAARPYTRSIAREAGMAAMAHSAATPRRQRDRVLQPLSSGRAGKATLLANIEGKVLTEPRVIKFRPSQRREHWKKNCIAVGLASGFIEPPNRPAST